MPPIEAVTLAVLIIGARADLQRNGHQSTSITDIISKFILPEVTNRSKSTKFIPTKDFQPGNMLFPSWPCAGKEMAMS